MIKRDTLAFRTLVAMARQRPEFDESSCHALLELIAVTEKIRALIREELAPLDLTEVQISMLVVLLALDPEPVLPSTLAEHTCVTRATATEVIDRLIDLGFAARNYGQTDRRNRLITLTKSGRRRADQAAVKILRTLARIARPLAEPAPRALLVLCHQLTSKGLSPGAHGTTPIPPSARRRGSDTIPHFGHPPTNVVNNES